MKIWNRIDESLSFFKAFQMVITIGPRTSKIAPRSSRYPPGSRSTFREESVKGLFSSWNPEKKNCDLATKSTGPLPDPETN